MKVQVKLFNFYYITIDKDAPKQSSNHIILECLVIIVISSSHDNKNNFPFYSGYILADELIEENASKDNGK